MDPYTEAHLFVAAIRLLHYQKQSPPTVEEVCETLNVSVESGLAVCRKLRKRAIVTISEDPFSIKLGIDNHLEIEELPREQEDGDSLSKDLEKFMAQKKDMDKKVEAIQAGLQKKRQDLHSDLEAKLREEMNKMKKG
ncbi:MAG: hypothetical protein HKN69_01310 [Desulfofustis sp.]|nr:hypothetical protein [Desulfofustis sp.]